MGASLGADTGGLHVSSQTLMFPLSRSTPPSPTSFSSLSLEVSIHFHKELKIQSCQWLTKEFCSWRNMRVGQRQNSFKHLPWHPLFPRHIWLPDCMRRNREIELKRFFEHGKKAQTYKKTEFMKCKWNMY